MCWSFKRCLRQTLLNALPVTEAHSLSWYTNMMVHLRLCVDYQWLNAVTQLDAYLMPREDELLDRLGKAKYLSILDIARGCWQVLVSQKDCHKQFSLHPLASSNSRGCLLAYAELLLYLLEHDEQVGPGHGLLHSCLY